MCFNGASRLKKARFYKGKIHVEFGCPLTGECSDSKAIAEEIDRQIISNYRVTENNQAEFDYLTENKKSLAFESLNKRMEGLKENEKKHFINILALKILWLKKLQFL